ncbi:hypothetical protein [Thermogemmatispora carboxidivorans]|uniref:hypothetical protein n=1 Tax=Thermogemmatispora carboxidivorans TaxID=1382306 RepID=UPI0012DD432C|nr:hypothetical protein [Thermogemmatispora carboxidivorans]
MSEIEDNRFTPEQQAALEAMKKGYQNRSPDDKSPAEIEEAKTDNRLNFAKYLVEQGKLNEGDGQKPGPTPGGGEKGGRGRG